MSFKGFILQPTYRIAGGRPVIHLYGRLESGESFLIQDDRQRPRFYVRKADRAQASQLGARTARSSRTTLDGHPAVRVELNVPSDAPALRNRLRRRGIPCYEADVRFAMRFLIDRGIRGSLIIEGEGKKVDGVGLVFRNPEVRPTRWRPELSLLSIDIETDPTASRLLSIALHGCGASEVLLLAPKGSAVPGQARGFQNQKVLLQAFVARVRDLDPDLITGWNVIDFDLRVLLRLAQREGVPLRLGRGSEALRLRDSRSPWNKHEALLTGRIVLDGIDLLRGSFIRMESYSLQAVSQQVLGESKLIGGVDRAEEILEAYENQRELFVEYNLTDARLVTKILERLNLLRLAAERSLLTGLPLNRTAASIAAFDFLYLSELHRRKIVAPSVGDSTTTGPNSGGHVLDPLPGLYRNVWVFDFKSLYPSLIRTFGIDPLGFRGTAEADQSELIRAPNGALFSRTPGILKGLLDELVPQREAARERADKVAAHAIKILMNSFYGVLGTPACRFHRPELAEAITSFGREILLWGKKRFESYGYQVLYGDTDSLFVLSGIDEAAQAKERGRELVRRLNQDLTGYVSKRWRTESLLELEFENLYLQLHLPEMRGRSRGARKRYVGQIEDEHGLCTIFTGMETVRRDWTELAKTVQRELYERLFQGREMEDYLHDTVADLRGGRLNHLLVYRKALRKKLEDYTSVTPPHVAAARKSSRPPGSVVRYLMTTAGPEPADEVQNPIDLEHYVQRQVKPVAQPLLDLQGLSFDKVIGDDAQLSLF